MKGLITKTLLVMSLVAFMSAANAGMMDRNNNMGKHKGMQKGLWVCETNASSASTDSDKRADEMLKNSRPAVVSFGSALKNCRDCTKITCTMQNDNAQSNTTTSN